MATLLWSTLGYVIYPVWLLAGVADYASHQRTHIAVTSGLREAMFHVAQTALMGVAVLLVLFVEINALSLSIIAACVLAHTVMAYWDIAYSDKRRYISPLRTIRARVPDYVADLRAGVARVPVLARAAREFTRIQSAASAAVETGSAEHDAGTTAAASASNDSASSSGGTPASEASSDAPDDHASDDAGTDEAGGDDAGTDDSGSDDAGPDEATVVAGEAAVEGAPAGAPKKKRRRRKKKGGGTGSAHPPAAGASDQGQRPAKKAPRHRASDRAPFHVGEEVFGKVTAVLDTAIMIDLSGKALAIFDRTEMEADDLVPAVGDRFVARVHNDGARGGLVVLTRKPLREEEDQAEGRAGRQGRHAGLRVSSPASSRAASRSTSTACAPSRRRPAWICIPANANFASLLGQRLDFKVVAVREGRARRGRHAPPDARGRSARAPQARARRCCKRGRS